MEKRGTRRGSQRNPKLRSTIAKRYPGKSHAASFQKNRLEKMLVNTQDAFAYTYLILSLDDMKKYNLLLLNEFILKKSRECQTVSDGKGMTSILKEGPMDISKSPKSPKSPKSKNLPIKPFLLDESKFLILVMKYNIVSQIEIDKTLLKSQKILDQILGHVIVQDNKEKKILGIFDVCLHHFEKTGYGTVLFTVALYCIDFHYYGQEYTIWLGVRLDNAQFEKVAYIYISSGFENPMITDKDLIGITYPYDILLLTKPVKKFISDERKTDVVFNKAMDMYANYHRSLKEKYATCSLAFEFDKSAIMKLRLFPYLGLEGYKGIHHKHLQKEFAGKFKIVNSRTYASSNQKKIVYKLSLETLAENEHIKYITGNEESVLHAQDIYTFHTHPVGLYVKYKLMIGTPSGPDFAAFIGFKESRFHIVCAVEGIYIISLAKEALHKSLTLANITIDMIRNTYEYPMVNRTLDWTGITEYEERDMKENIQKYLVWFDKINDLPNFGKLFDLQFLYWRDLKKDTVMEIFYKTRDKTCFPELYEDI
jgi:hypothetical protein